MSEQLATYQEILRGWRYFWSQTEITHFEKDKDGKHILDKNGAMIAVRTDKQRQFPTKMNSYFKNHDRREKKSDP
ncbi:MAG: hypothetical protein CMI27_02005 [Opitutae bacterium]|nr:hypothetical protein [Opitutae bacterium]|tara:strand:- start:1292 stop:1516 length:225 start_codon:yes stop_codon:yes gene_type:complete